MPIPQKVVVVAYEMWSFTRGRSNCRALTGKNLVFWIGGRLREVVAHLGSTVFFIRFSFSSDERVNNDWLQCS